MVNDVIKFLVKTIYLSTVLLFSIDAFCSEFIEGRDYVVIHESEPNRQVTHFFSFGCRSCFLVNQMIKSIEKASLCSINIEKCHVYTSPFSKYLSKAWVVANQLGIAEQVDNLLFKGIQNQTITNESEVKEIFLIAGISEEEFDLWMCHPQIEEHLKKNFDQVNQLKISEIPAIVVGNKFLVKLVRFPWNDQQAFAERYQCLVSELLEKIS